MKRRQRNIEAFTDKRGVVHPIRRSSGYDDEKTGSIDFDFRDWAAEEREQRQDEERELKKEYARYHPEAGKSLATFVRQRGGFRYDGIHDGEIDRLRKGESGTSGLVSLDKGKGLTFKRGRGLKPDRMLETAIEAGVVSPDTSLAQFMDDVEMSATKRNPKPKTKADHARLERLQFHKEMKLKQKAQRATAAMARKIDARLQKLDARWKKRKLGRYAGKAKNPFPSATVEKAWQAWRKAEKAKSPKAQALETKFVKVYMASQKKKRNFTIKAAGRLKVGNPGVQRVRRLRARTAKQERISPELGAKAHAQSERAFKQWAVARDRRVGKAIVSGRKWPKFGKQNPPATWQLKKPNPKGTADHDAARELTLFILNDYQLYSRRLPSFIANVARKMKAGTYDHQKAAKLYSYLAQEGAKKYSREYSTGRDSAAMFSPATRLETGRQLADHYEQAAREEAERLKQKKPARRKNISIKVGGKTRFKASKKGVSIGGRIQLKANPGAKKNGSISEKRQDRLWRSAQKAQKAGKTALADQRLTRSAALARKLQDKWYSQTRVEDRKKRFKNPVRIVFNRLLGGWYVVHGPHQTPIAGRFSSREEAKAHMAAQQAARDQRGLPKHRRNGIFETFTGRKATKQTALNAPDGTPKRLDKLGKLIGLYAENGTIKPRVPVWLCSDSKGKLHLATSAARLIDGGPQSFGEVKKIEYETTKKHLDGKPTIYFHHFGEEGGKRPTLHADGKGGLKLRGGSYKIRAEGIRD